MVEVWGMRLERLLLSLVIFALAGLVVVLMSAQDAQGDGCSNEAIRATQGATSLPDCRAYELVSPPDGTPSLQGAQHLGKGVRASSGGEKISWFSEYPLPGSGGGGFYNLSSRSGSGWTSQSVGPLLSSSNTSLVECHAAVFFSDDLSEAVVTDGFDSAGVDQPAEETCGNNNPPLVSGEPEGFQNVFVRNTPSGTYALANITPMGVTPNDATFQDASADFSHVVFEDGTKLTENAPAGATLYEWVSGEVHLVSVLPGGVPGTGVIPGSVGNGQGSAPILHAVSSNGSRVIFYSENKLFLRVNVESNEESLVGPKGECLEPLKACTVQLDASDVEGPGGGGSLVAADARNDVIFLTDDASAKLTADTAEGSGQHLYEYDESTGALTDLTPAGALELQGFSGMSADGSYLYVVATAALAEGATLGQPNLYMFHAGSIRLIATLEASEIESSDWTPTFLTARVSSDGRYVAFDSMRKLTGYENTPAQPEDCTSVFGAVPCEEIFLYDAGLGRLSCVSCDPGGAPPAGPTELQPAERSSENPAPVYLQRNLLDDGTVLFDSPSALTSSAVPGVSDVYEYGSGALSLISSGSSNENSFFYEASADGQDVFFVTTQHLVRGDTGTGNRLYDARVDGGFLEPEASPPLCTGEGCRVGTPVIPGLPSVASATVGPSGNVVPAKKHNVTPTRKQRLQRALRACRRVKRLRPRAACVHRARARYGVHAARSTATRRGGGK